MPNSVTIWRATVVARSMSFAAPVVGSEKISSSAVRPAEQHRQLVGELAAGDEELVLHRAA